MAKITQNLPSQPVQKAQSDQHRLQVKDRHFIPEPYKKVAEGMEKQFAEYMLEQMDRSIDRADESSSSMEYYDSVMREQRADSMAKNSNLGLQKTILDQIYPERMRNQFMYQQYLNSQAPVKKNLPSIGRSDSQNQDSKVGNGGSNE